MTLLKHVVVTGEVKTTGICLLSVVNIDAKNSMQLLSIAFWINNIDPSLDLRGQIRLLSRTQHLKLDTGYYPFGVSVSSGWQLLKIVGVNYQLWLCP